MLHSITSNSRGHIHRKSAETINSHNALNGLDIGNDVEDLRVLNEHSQGGWGPVEAVLSAHLGCTRVSGVLVAFYVVHPEDVLLCWWLAESE